MAFKELRLALSFESAEDRNARRILSEPTVIKSWGFDELENDLDADELTSKPPWGAAIGCADGSVYIFHPQLAKTTKRQKSLKNRRLSGGEGLPPYRRAAHAHAHLSLSRSRNASPAASKTNLAMSATKSRAVSGLTRTEVEAPKNYVDFEDEQEKMKGMIADRPGGLNVRDTAAARDRRPSVTSHVEMPVLRFDPEAKSGYSTPSTSSLRSAPLSPPLSPGLEAHRVVHSRKTLRLHTRITPRDYGYGHGVVAMEILEGGELLLVLQESGKLSVFRTIDGVAVSAISPGDVVDASGTTVVAHGSGSRILWTWCLCHVLKTDSSILIITVANADSRTTALDTGQADEKSRITIFDLRDVAQYQLGRARLTKRHEVVVENQAEGLAFSDVVDHSIKLYLVDSVGQLFTRSLSLPNWRETTESAPRRQTSLASGSRDLSISLPQAIKELVSRSELPTPVDETKGGLARLNGDTPSLIGTLPLTSNIRGLRIRKDGEKIVGLAWSESELLIFDIVQNSISLRYTIPSINLLDVTWNGSALTAFYPNEVISYRISPDSSGSGEESPEIMTSTLLHASQRGNTVVVEHEARQQLLCVEFTPELQRVTALTHARSKNQTGESQPLTMWSSTDLKTLPATVPVRLTALLPLESSSIICGYSNGELRRYSLKGLVNEEWQNIPSKQSIRAFAILSLFAVKNLRTGEPFVMGGGDDGSISIWEMKTLKLKARWIIFTESLKQVVELKADVTGRMRGCCLAVSGDGTIAMIAIDGLDLLYVVPGSPAPLRTICLNTDNLLLFYADNRTRLWDVRTNEFRRSMTSEKATEMLGHGDWDITDVQDGLTETPGAGSLTALNRTRADGEPSPTLLFDVDSVAMGPLGDSLADGKQSGHEHHQTLLAALHTPGLDEHIDPVFAEYAGVLATKRSARISSYDTEQSLQTFYAESSHSFWQISSEVSTARLLCILAILKAEANSRAHERSVDALILFYSAALPMLVGPLYRPPTLVALVHYRNESKVPEVRAAALKLFECELARLPNDEVAATVETWQHTLPCLLPDVEKQSEKAALSLGLCGNIAIEKYNLLSTTTLTDIAKSITIYLYDERSPHRTLAIELCSRGFETWQQYFDAMEALRSLFTLATTSRKESISIRNPGPHARMAVLQIAESNSALFVTTLSLDILHPRSIEYSKSVMQIIAFLIKMKPLVLFPNLPRLMEAVVKSLDPGSNADREAVLDTVTEIIALVVQTFPTIDFHSGSQRLAVGTSEGAVIMYDLKTATRLYVLEGHRKPLAGLSFSPDGRRLVTISLEENVALVWKVGSSFVSLFHPGAPPRQGRSGSEPFKTLNFVLKDEATPSLETSLKQVHFSWPSDRSVKIDIIDATFTFST